MHKIVKNFIEKENIFKNILSNGELDPSQPVEVVFPVISEQMNNRYLPAETYQAIDEAIQKGHPDKDVFFLFLLYLIPFYSIREMREKSESIYRISSSFDVNKCPVEIQAYYHQSCSYFFHIIKDYAKRDELNYLAMQLMPKNSTRYYKFLSNTAQFLGLEGQLRILPKSDLELLERYSNRDITPLRCFLFNAIFTVDITLAEVYCSKLTTNFAEEHQGDLEYIKTAINFLKGIVGENKPTDKAYNPFITYYQALKIKDLSTANKTQKKMIADSSNNRLWCIFDFANYHHAFVTGRYDIIEDALNNQDKEKPHYFLDFFFARYFLAKNNLDLARFHYAQLLKNCERLGAMGRLRYELQFAVELDTTSLFELAQPIQNSAALDMAKTNTITTHKDALRGLDRLIGQTLTIKDIKKKVASFANIQRPLLIMGETGVGKEVVARAIHEESTLKTSPFLAINCGALTDTLLQSELFGYEAGAFTGAVHMHKGIFESAEDGVVFLDEFGEMSHKLQVSLLRVLENNEVFRVGGTKACQIKCRIIAATNANIEELITQKLFREDLYHRLKQFSIYIPPLRERKEDIPELAHYFLNQQNPHQKQLFSEDLISAFKDHHWPGNVRELKNEIDQIKVLCDYRPVIELEDVDEKWLRKKQTPETQAVSNPTASQDEPSDIDEQMHQRIINKKLTFADKRNQQILKLFQKYKQLTRGQIAEALQISLLTATKDLQRLCAEGVLIKKTPTPSPRSHYFELK